MTNFNCLRKLSWNKISFQSIYNAVYMMFKQDILSGVTLAGAGTGRNFPAYRITHIGPKSQFPTRRIYKKWQKVPTCTALYLPLNIELSIYHSVFKWTLCVWSESHFVLGESYRWPSPVFRVWSKRQPLILSLVKDE